MHASIDSLTHSLILICIGALVHAPLLELVWRAGELLKALPQAPQVRNTLDLSRDCLLMLTSLRGAVFGADGHGQLPPAPAGVAQDPAATVQGGYVSRLVGLTHSAVASLLQRMAGPGLGLSADRLDDDVKFCSALVHKLFMTHSFSLLALLPNTLSLLQLATQLTVGLVGAARIMDDAYTQVSEAFDTMVEVWVHIICELDAEAGKVGAKLAGLQSWVSCVTEMTSSIFAHYVER